MLELLKGRVRCLEPGELEVLTAGGVGFLVRVVPGGQEEALADGRDDQELRVHEIVTDSSRALYGFEGFERRSYFRELLKVKGVGPKHALGILGTFTRRGLIELSAEGEVKRLSENVRGVGPRLAVEVVRAFAKKLVEFD